ncbi:MAG: neutral/alkaline non-lysosomal ceramidase N-terminal domain-containing protein [Planctomycetia bacterium]|nr:neutral/alkaline non-lysosomal ceramidase N-terminal domain-containing protein [Planctomycetia bacterium]
MPFSIKLALGACCLFAATAGSLPAQDWKAGAAAAVIMPQEPTWLSGYSSRTAPAEGKVHELHAKALAIEDAAGTRLVIVTLDLGSVSQEITDAVFGEVSKRHHVKREGLILNCSHTHCAPEVAAERRVFHALPDGEEAKLARYIEWLKGRIVEAVDGAFRELSPARLTLSKSSANFGHNRRLPTPTGYVNSQNDEGVTDHDVPVLRVTDAAGKLRAVLFGYACHNTTLAFQLYCGDYAGFAQQHLEEAHPESKALFFMGCGGDQNPYPRHGPRGLEYCRQHGKALAGAVEEALAGQQREVRGPLRLAYEVATLELEPLPAMEKLQSDAQNAKDHRQRKALYLLDRLAKEGKIELAQRCPLHAARFGDDLLLLAISGETVVDYSLRCKKEFARRADGGKEGEGKDDGKKGAPAPAPFVWVSGYNDDVFAYLPSQRVLREGGYEGRDGIIHQLTPTPFAETVEERVMGGISRLVEKVSK